MHQISPNTTSQMEQTQCSLYLSLSLSLPLTFFLDVCLADVPLSISMQQQNIPN